MLRLFDLIPRWVWASLAIALSATSCKLKLDKDGLSIEIEKVRTALAQTNAEFEAARAAASDRFAELVETYRAREQGLQVAAEEIRRDRDVQVAAARRSADHLRERLRLAVSADNPETAAGSPLTSPVAGPEPFASGTVGALLRDEAPEAARLLVDEAERADAVRIALQACYKQYDAALEVINGLD